MTVFLTRRAEKNYDAIKAHIRRKWGEKTAEEFILKTDELKPRKSTSKSGALSGKSLVRGTMQYSGDNDYPAPDAQQCV